MIQLFSSLNWTAIIIAIVVCITAPRCLNFTLQISRVLRDISKVCAQMEELHQRAKTEMKHEWMKPKKEAAE